MSRQSGQHHPRVARSWEQPNLSRSDPPETHVQAVCTRLLRLHEEAVALLLPDDPLLIDNQKAQLASAKQRRADALRDLYRCHAESLADVRAMLDVLSVLEEWFGEDDLSTNGFALHITHVIRPFIDPTETRMGHLNEKAVPRRVSSPWFGRLPKLF